MSARRGGLHLLHLALTALGAAVWSRIWWPGAVYLGLVAVRDLLAITAQETGYLRLQAWLTLIQRLLYAGLLIACAWSIDQDEMLGVVAIWTAVYEVLRHGKEITVKLVYDKGGFVERTDRTLAGIFGTLAILSVLFAHYSLFSPAWWVSALLAVFLTIKARVAKNRFVNGQVLRSSIVRPLVLGYDTAWLITGGVLCLF